MQRFDPIRSIMGFLIRNHRWRWMYFYASFPKLELFKASTILNIGSRMTLVFLCDSRMHIYLLKGTSTYLLEWQYDIPEFAPATNQPLLKMKKRLVLGIKPM